MQGFLNLNKPQNFTSHDCVAKVRRLLRLKRVGHAGTLDPAATGVLPIALGRATRLLQFLRQDKAYQATIRLGLRTTTDDLEGQPLEAKPCLELTLETVKTALRAFQGTIQQVPPNYSAIQIQGKRLYDLARAGETIVAKPREVEIYQLDGLDWRPGDFPELDLAIACGPGTYIRSIARDLGEALQTGGTLAQLIRTSSSGFNLSDSLTLDELESQIQAGRFQPITPEVALQHLPTIVLPSDLAKRWCQGQKVLADAINSSSTETVPLDLVAWRVYNQDELLLGIGRWVDNGIEIVLAPQVVLEPIA